jgi:hypothetical protein
MNFEGSLSHFNYSPKGEPEALMLSTSKGLVQINFPAAQGSTLVARLKEGEKIKVKATPLEDTHKSVHPVHQLDEWESGSGPVKIHAVIEVEGTVKRFNYTRHGEVNGVVLESGDFIHLKPHGARAADLTVGSKVKAKGPGHQMGVSGLRVVEAERINGLHLEKLEAARKTAKKAVKKVAKKAVKKAPAKKAK